MSSVLPPFMAFRVSDQLKILQLRGIVQASRWWMYVAVADEKTCEDCEQYNASIMSMMEVNGQFPEKIEHDDELIFPMVHPHDRCMLVVKAGEYTPDSLAKLLEPAEDLDPYSFDWGSLSPPDPLKTPEIDLIKKNPGDYSFSNKIHQRKTYSDDIKRIQKAFQKQAVFNGETIAHGEYMFKKWVKLNRIDVESPYGTRKTFPKGNTPSKQNSPEDTGLVTPERGPLLRVPKDVKPEDMEA